MLKRLLNHKIRKQAEVDIPQHLQSLGFDGNEIAKIMKLVVGQQFGIPIVDLAFSPAQPSRHVASVIADRVLTNDLLYSAEINEKDVRAFRANVSLSFLSKKTVHEMQAEEAKMLAKLQRLRAG